MERRACVLRLLVVGVVLGAVSAMAPPAGADSVPLDPHLFRISASDFPWHTKKLLDARIEGSNRAVGDAVVIYDAVSSSLPSWTDLNRQTGWYEDALMHKKRMNPAAVLFVSQYGSVRDAQRALQAEQQFQSYRPLTATLDLGDESYEYASSTAIIYGSKPVIVDDIVICTRIQNVEFDVAVFDVHAVKYHWYRSYRKVALRLAGQLTTVGAQALTAP